MTEKKLSELLRAVSEKSFRKLEAFINSPYHNQDKNIIKLYQILKNNRAGNETHLDVHLSNDELAKSLFAGDKNAKRKTILLLTEFKKILSSFMLSEYLENNPTEKQFTLMRVYKELHMAKNYSGLKDKYTRKITTEDKHTWDYYYRDMLLERDDKLSRVSEIIYSESTELEELSESIDLFFICTMLRVYSSMARHQKETLFSLDYSFRFKKLLVDYISDNEPFIKKEHPLLYAYYLVLMMIEENKGDRYFNQLKKYLLANMNKFSITVFKELLIEYKDSCNAKIHLNPVKFGKEILFVYRLLDKKNAYAAEGGIEDNDFMDTITYALAFNRIKWAHSFFNKHKNKINSDNEDTVHIVKARLDFHSKNYTAALGELNKINSKQFYFYLRIRILRIKIYYDLNEIDAVTYIIDAVKHYITRNKKLIGTNFDLINNLLIYLNKIIKVRLGKIKDSKTKLLNDIEEIPNIASKDWLIEKINTLN